MTPQNQDEETGAQRPSAIENAVAPAGDFEASGRDAGNAAGEHRAAPRYDTKKRSEAGRKGAIATNAVGVGLNINEHCRRCGRGLARQNRSRFCRPCQREFGLPLLRKRVVAE